MSLKLVVAFEILSLTIECSSQSSSVIPFCFEAECYIRPESIGKSWLEAQQNCRMYNSTLPIVDNSDRQRRVSVAFNYFGLNGTADAWLGANATDYGSGNWSWLDGRHYSGSVVQNFGPYNKSYAFLSKNGTGVLAYASAPYENYSYICQYDTTTTDVCNNGTGRLAFLMEKKCYVKYSDKLSWFNARNNCSQNKGDLASFENVSLLDGIVDSIKYWIALRCSQWKWQVAVTGVSFDVTFTSWKYDQPDDATPTCISTDFYNFPSWRDKNCSDVSQYICQLLNSTTSTAWTKSTSAWTKGPSTSPLPVGTSGRTNIISSSPGNGSTSEMTVRLAIGLGVGLGTAFVIAIVVIIIIFVVRRNRQNSDANGKSMFRGEIDQMSSEREATEINETGNVNQFTLVDPATLYAPVLKNKSQHTTRGGQFQSNEASTNYATVKEVQGLELNSQENSLPSIQGPVYAGLGFGQSSS